MPNYGSDHRKHRWVKINIPRLPERVRYTGPQVRSRRRIGTPIFAFSKYLERRTYPPGAHGPKSRRKHSDYAIGLMEKQKLRFQYCVLEKQFRRFFAEAQLRKGVTGAYPLPTLALRLDNVC